jgi:hypothetical protein
MEAVAKSYMRKGFLIYEEMHKYLAIYEEAVSIFDFVTAPFWISLYEENFVFFFISAVKLVVTRKKTRGHFFLPFL